MKLVFRLVAIAALVALGYWAWTSVFPNPKKQIRHRLEKLAEVASYGPNEGALAKLANVQKLGGFFSENVQIKVDVSGAEPHTFENRDELMQAVGAARAAVKNIKARFSAMNIEVTPGKAEAIVDLALNADVGEERDAIFQELKFNVKKVNGDWVITRIDTVKSLK